MLCYSFMINMQYGYYMDILDISLFYFYKPFNNIF